MAKINEVMLEMHRITESEKTKRLAIVAFLIGAPLICLIVCGTIVAMKWMDDPAWLKLMFAILSPTGLFAFICWFVVWRRMRNLQELDRKVKWHAGVNGQQNQVCHDRPANYYRDCSVPSLLGHNHSILTSHADH